MIIANCHCLPLAEALPFIGRGIEKSDFIDVNFATQPHMVEKIDLIHSDPSWRVLSFTLSANFERLETSSLKQTLGDRLTTFTNTYFSGLHPDITYVGGMGQRVASAIGDYHSKIVLASYATGRTEDDCLRLFNGGAYEKLGYYQEYALSAQNLLERDAACDVKFAQTFLDMVTEIPTLYTINHPTGAVFLALTEKLAASQGLDYISFAPAFFQNHLSTNNIWPVYNEISEHHGLKYRTPQYYGLGKALNSRMLSRAEFVHRSYQSYAAIADQQKLREVTANMSFYKTFCDTL
jgi:hypothetical protein